MIFIMLTKDVYHIQVENGKKLLSLNQKFFSKIIIDGMILIILS